jgi:UDP-2,3-diacylglucosamine hydrolase
MDLSGIPAIVGHGDGLGPGEHFYKLLKAVFANRLCQEAFGFLHPNVGLWIAHQWSNGSRSGHSEKEMAFKGEKEFLWQWAKEQHAQDATPHLYLFGHRHLPLWLPVGTNAHYLNLGDWFSKGLYAKFSDNAVSLSTEDHQEVDLIEGVLRY